MTAPSGVRPPPMTTDKSAFEKLHCHLAQKSYKFSEAILRLTLPLLTVDEADDDDGQVGI